MSLQAENYPPPVAELLRIEATNALVPQGPLSAAYGDSATREKLSGLAHKNLFGSPVIADRQMADCCLAGLWLRFDFLDESHTISQGISTPTGSYWHGIMHRREPDWSNAKYWFHKVGSHEIFDDLLAAAQRISAGFDLNTEGQSLAAARSWDPFAFVDLCQAASGTGDQLETVCQQIQLAEWELLFDWCYQRAQ